jgi:SAM-dependent methyltransferase
MPQALALGVSIAVRRGPESLAIIRHWLHRAQTTRRAIRNPAGTPSHKQTIATPPGGRIKVKMSIDPKRVVADGYDQIAERYRAWAGDELGGPRARYLAPLWEHVPAGAPVLELGCATGIPVARALAARFVLTGVDLSPRQIALAHQNVPGATFVCADMTTLDPPPDSFAAIVAFYALLHVPRDEHPALLAKIAAWLLPGGLFVATLGTGDDPGTVEPDWLGAPMYFSSHDAATGKRLVTAAGLNLLNADLVTDDEDGRPVTFLWIVAQKPDPAVS